MAKPKSKNSKNGLVVNLDTDLSACFMSKFRNYRLVLESRGEFRDRDGNVKWKDGLAVQFEDGFAIIDDQDIVSLMLNDKNFGVDFCIDPSDRTGFWKVFRANYPDTSLAEFFPMGVPKALQADMAGSVAAEMARHAGIAPTQRGVIVAARGKVPILDGGRERLTEEQEAKFAEIQAGQGV